MKNFGVLYCYELKKLLKRKMAWIMVLVLAAIMVYAAWPTKTSGGTSFSLTDQAGNTISEYVSAEEQRRLRQEGELQISGQIMDDQFFQSVREASAGNGQYIIKDNFDLDSYFYLVDNRYYQPYSIIKYNMDLDPAGITEEQFYQERQRTIDMQLSELTDSEIAYWQAMEAQVEKPFVYRYSDGYQDIVLNAFGLYSVIPLIAAVCLCGVFSEERRTRTDALIFSSRQGRFPQYLAKVLAGVTVTLAAVLFVIGVDVVVVLLTRGYEGFDAALQMWNPISSLPITMGQAALITVRLLLLYGLLSGGITMLISVLTQNTVAAIAGPVLLMLGQSWLRLDVQPAEYLPNQMFNTLPSFRNFHLVNFFGVYLNNLQFGFIVYGTLAVILTALCWLGWRRSATGSR